MYLMNRGIRYPGTAAQGDLIKAVLLDGLSPVSLDIPLPGF
jgi:hypothetical protein